LRQRNPRAGLLPRSVGPGAQASKGFLRNWVRMRCEALLGQEEKAAGILLDFRF
jgi:hypothetical protein